ncbi:hypothetical protein F4782DRAFT_287225 [Xylaria castorea]|nr:hypothetical protein F4782DRAFT_287225 [Xylaria castorea]
MTVLRHQHASPNFVSSVCPEPGAFTFISCTILSMAWIFLQICWSCSATPCSTQEDKKSNSSLTKKIATSIFYLTVVGILLLDICWLTTIFMWGIRQLSTGPTYGILDQAFTKLISTFYSFFLLGLVVLWLWTLRRIMRRVLDLWANQHLTITTSTRSFNSKSLS